MPEWDGNGNNTANGTARNGTTEAPPTAPAETTAAMIITTTVGPKKPSLEELLGDCIVSLSVSGKETQELKLDPPKPILSVLITGTEGLSKNTEIKINGGKVFKVGFGREVIRWP